MLGTRGSITSVCTNSWRNYGHLANLSGLRSPNGGPLMRAPQRLQPLPNQKAYRIISLFDAKVMKIGVVAWSPVIASGTVAHGNTSQLVLAACCSRLILSFTLPNSLPPQQQNSLILK